MNKTITVPQNGTQETLVIVAQKANDVSEQKTSFTDIRNIIVAEEADGKYDQTTSFPGIIKNSIVTQEAIDVHQQKTGFSGIIGMDSQGFMDPRNHCQAIARSKEISYIRSEILSPERTNEIISPSKGATT